MKWGTVLFTQTSIILTLLHTVPNTSSSSFSSWLVCVSLSVLLELLTSSVVTVSADWLVPAKTACMCLKHYSHRKLLKRCMLPSCAGWSLALALDVPAVLLASIVMLILCIKSVQILQLYIVERIMLDNNLHQCIMHRITDEGEWTHFSVVATRAQTPDRPLIIILCNTV